MADLSVLTNFPWPEFLGEQHLPARYRATAERWFAPLLQTLIARQQSNGPGLLVGINGAQGSGKSTLGAFLQTALTHCAGLKVVTVSLDDFYLTRAQREVLARDVHPLLRTRGVPGTHDTPLMASVLQALRTGTGQVAVPRFDKSVDDRTDPAQWHQIGAPVDVVIWEGWCLGVPVQPEVALFTAINPLERIDDVDGNWRRYVNAQLAEHYQPLFDTVDVWAMLAAPSFDCVWRWRCEQEEKLAAQVGSDASGIMSPGDIARFIQFYQRLTEWGLEAVPPKVHFFYPLSANRQIQNVFHPRPLPPTNELGNGVTAVPSQSEEATLSDVTNGSNSSHQALNNPIPRTPSQENSS